MTFFQHVACPFGIIRGIIILAVARLLAKPAQSFVFLSESKFHVFLFLAVFMDLLSRIAGVALNDRESNDYNEFVFSNLKEYFQAFFLSKYGGQLFLPVWVGCVIVYFFF